MTDHQERCWAELPPLIAAVQAAGDAIGLPYIAAQADLGDPEPMGDAQGRPYAETSFHWVDPDHAYWRDRKLALQTAFLTAARLVAEPFFYSDGQLRTWRATRLLEAVDCEQAKNTPSFGEAIIAPVHLPRGLVGVVFWCSREPVGVEALFERHAGDLHNLALKLVATHNEARGRPRNATVPQTLTRREVQCLRWAAAGKTDGEIAAILTLSMSTVRFHLRNAAAKLGTTGRAQSIQIAAGLGFVGAP